MFAGDVKVTFVGVPGLEREELYVSGGFKEGLLWTYARSGSMKRLSVMLEESSGGELRVACCLHKPCLAGVGRSTSLSRFPRGGSRQNGC
jgi:hypothetical protein